MKYLFFLLAFLFSMTIYGQSDIQIVKIKHEDKSVAVYAVNNSEKLSYYVEVTITPNDMKLEYPVKPIIKLAPGVEQEVAVLIPRSMKSKYKINFKATQIVADSKYVEGVVVPDVTIYTKNGHEKSTELRLYLEKHEIPFNEINTSYSVKSEEVYKKMLERRGISKSKLPVVIIRGEVFHNIRDMNKFLEKHFESK